jgi:hypothetical protein
MNTIGNEIEPKWRTKMLFESTPRGNVIMFYDAFKEGFSYYSDQSSIPYKIINAVVMRYVILYRCRDFFIDDCDTVEGYASPFVVMTLEEEEKEALKKRDVMRQFKSKDKSLPFAKLKSAFPATLHDVSGSEKTESSVKETFISAKKNYTNNKIIYLGKISNVSLLQRVSNTPINMKDDDVEDDDETFDDIEINPNYIEKYKHTLDSIPHESMRFLDIQAYIKRPEHVPVKNVSPIKFSYGDYKQRMTLRK